MAKSNNLYSLNQLREGGYCLDDVMFVKQKSKIVENKEKCGENIRIIKTTQKNTKICITAVQIMEVTLCILVTWPVFCHKKCHSQRSDRSQGRKPVPRVCKCGEKQV